MSRARAAVIAALLALIATGVLVVWGRGDPSPRRDTPRLVWGVWAAPRDGRTYRQELEYLESLIGRRFAAARFYLRFDSSINPAFLDDLFGTRLAFLSWVMRRQDGSSLRWSEVSSGRFDPEIAAQADAFRAWGRSVLVAFAPEPEDDRAGTPEEYAAVWRRVVGIFRDRGVTNVSFVWNLMAWSFPDHADRWYPGDAYVDYIAADGYNWFGFGNQRWRGFTDVFDGFYAWGSERRKPLAIGEFGSLEDVRTPDPHRRARWLDAAARQLRRWPNIRLVTYFNGQGWWFDTHVDGVTRTPRSVAAFKAIGLDPYFTARSLADG